MGVFSSKYVTNVGTVTSRVIADNRVPNSIKTGITKALFSSDGQLVENILEEMVSGVGLRATNMYKYGRDHYSFGLPSGTMLASSDGTGAVASLLKTLFGASTTVSYHHFGPLNNLHFGWKKLCDLYAYDSVTNQLGTISTAKGVPVYLKDMVVVVKDATFNELANGSLDQWGTSPNTGYTPERAVIGGGTRVATPFKVSSTAANDSLEVTYVWQTSTVVTVEGVSVTRQVMDQETIAIPVSNYDETADYYQVKYVSGGKDGYWLYRSGAGTYPVVDAVFTPQSHTSGTYFPIGYFRYNKQNVASTPTSAECKEAIKLTKYLGIDFVSLAKSIDENPDIEQVESALLMMAVPAVTTDPIEQRYLYEFFDRIYAEVGSSTVGATGLRLGIPDFIKAPPTSISLVIQDTRFKTALRCAAVIKVSKAGVLGPVGTFASGRDTKQVTTKGHGPNLVSTVAFHYYRKQISDVLYDEIEVVGLQMTYHVYGEYTTVGDEADDILLIPLDYAITNVYSLPDKETLYARSLHYVFNSRVVTEVKWYMQSWFQWVIIIVAVVIAVIDGGYTFASVMSAIAAASAYEIAVYIAIKLAVYFVSREVFKLFVKVLGPKAAMFLAVIAAAVGVAQGNQTASILADVPWADKLLLVSAGLTAGVQLNLKDEMVGLSKEYKEFEDMMETKNTFLEDINDKLDASSSTLTPFILPYEKPEDFYNRTVHSGNIGVLGLDMISMYVDNKLTLPKLSEIT